MAIKVSGTEVISDSRALSNIATVDATTAEAISAAGVGGGGTVDFTASGAVSNGDVVSLNSDGTVSVSSASFVGAQQEFTTDTTTNTAAVFDPDTGKIVIAYRSVNFGYAVVGTVSGASISFGTPVAFLSFSAGDISIAYDSNSNKVVISYNDDGNSFYGTAIVGTVSGTSISFGTPTVFESATTTKTSTTFDSNSNKVVIAYRDNNNSSYGTAVVGTVSGTSISFGTPVVFNSSGTTDHISATFDSNSNKVVIAYENGGNSSYGTAIVGTVSGTSISFGTPVVFDSVAARFMSGVFDSSTNKVVIAYAEASFFGYGRAVVGTVSGTSISFGTPVEYLGGVALSESSAVFDSVSNKVTIVFDTSALQAVQAAVSGTSLTFGAAQSIYSGNANNTSSVFEPNVGATIAVYKDGSNGDDGTANVVKFGNGNERIGVATSAISDGATGTVTIIGGVNESQSGLIPSTQYYLSTTTDGGLSASVDSGVIVGRAIAADKLLVTEG